MRYFDLIIVGGGAVGAGLSIALKETGLKIALIDATAYKHDDPRLFALNAGSCQFLKNLRLWPVLAQHAAVINQVHVSSQGYFGAVRLRSDEIALPELGHVIPARYLDEALQKALLDLNHCTVYRPAKLQTLSQSDHLAQLTILTEEGEQLLLQAPLVIGADGTQSTVREQLSIQTTVFDYEQSAIVTKTTLHRSHHHIAYERFTPQGAIAMLPLTGNECATIWTADNKTITDLMAMTSNDFLSHLQQTFGYRLGKLVAVENRNTFPLRMVKAEKPMQGCVYLLGNAAHTLHPIAAQGLNLALYEVAVLVESLTKKMNQGQLFSANDFESVYSRIQRQQANSIGFSHRLASLFSKPSWLLGLTVPIGMMGLDIATPIKKRLMEGIIGRRGCVPRLLLSDGI
jgi:2-octaprenyl-6-methoxyphenol hydroxylase